MRLSGLMIRLPSSHMPHHNTKQSQAVPWGRTAHAVMWCNPILRMGKRRQRVSQKYIPGVKGNPSKWAGAQWWSWWWGRGASARGWGWGTRAPGMAMCFCAHGWASDAWNGLFLITSPSWAMKNNLIITDKILTLILKMLHRYDKRADMWWMTGNCMNHLSGFVRHWVKDERERKTGFSNSAMNLNSVRHTQTTYHISGPAFPSYAAAHWYRDCYWDNIWCLQAKCLFAFIKWAGSTAHECKLRKRTDISKATANPLTWTWFDSCTYLRGTHDSTRIWTELH